MSAWQADLSTDGGLGRLPNPIMTASGTSGHGTELADYGDLSALGAVVVKSLSRPARGRAIRRRGCTRSARACSTASGLQGPGLAAWLEHDLPALCGVGARVVVSIWGARWTTTPRRPPCWPGPRRTSPALVAVEVNVSCPNVEDRSRMFAHSASATEEVLAGHRVRPAAVGQVEPERARHRRDRRRRPSAAAPRASPWSTPCSGWPWT